MNARDEMRWWSKVIPTGGCWEWTGNIKPNGYGYMKVGRASRYAHRLAYEHFVGPIPEAMTVDHLCFNKSCVNVAHMEVVSNGENARRGKVMKKPRTHCRYGHELTPDNITDRHGCRTCAKCAERWDRDRLDRDWERRRLFGVLARKRRTTKGQQELKRLGG